MHCSGRGEKQTPEEMWPIFSLDTASSSPARAGLHLIISFIWDHFAESHFLTLQNNWTSHNLRGGLLLNINYSHKGKRVKKKVLYPD